MKYLLYTVPFITQSLIIVLILAIYNFNMTGIELFQSQLYIIPMTLFWLFVTHLYIIRNKQKSNNSY